MIRSGILAFIIYLLGALGGSILALRAYIELNYIESSGDADSYAVAAAIITIFGLIIAIPYLVCLIAKIIHLASGLKFFGIICIILDVVIIGVLAHLFSIDIDIGVDTTAAQIICMIPSSVALLSNAISLTK